MWCGDVVAAPGPLERNFVVEDLSVDVSRLQSGECVPLYLKNLGCVVAADERAAVVVGRVKAKDSLRRP
jgi:hypothetical protein